MPVLIVAKGTRLRPWIKRRRSALRIESDRQVFRLAIYGLLDSKPSMSGLGTAAADAICMVLNRLVNINGNRVLCTWDSVVGSVETVEPKRQIFKWMFWPIKNESQWKLFLFFGRIWVLRQELFVGSINGRIVKKQFHILGHQERQIVLCDLRSEIGYESLGRAGVVLCLQEVVGQINEVQPVGQNRLGGVVQIIEYATIHVVAVQVLLQGVQRVGQQVLEVVVQRVSVGWAGYAAASRWRRHNRRKAPSNGMIPVANVPGTSFVFIEVFEGGGVSTTTTALYIPKRLLDSKSSIVSATIRPGIYLSQLDTISDEVYLAYVIAQ